MRYFTLLIAALFLFTDTTTGQSINVHDDFEGAGTITTWFGDDCSLNTSLSNPVQQGINTSSTVLEYSDMGGQYANVRFDVSANFDLSSNYTFSIKVFVPASGLTGSQPAQVSLKLQDGTIGAPWSTQCEIIKPLSVDQWQTITFDFMNDNYMNLDGASPPPTQRTDFNRVVIQLNGENNNDHVLGYIDDVNYDGTIPADPVFDNLVWFDEFDVDGAINSEKWFHQTQLPWGGSWYNGEIQHYTDRIDNSYVENGILKIVAKKETYSNQGHTKQYTSARLNSKFTFQYGKVEIRAKLPSGAGTWPAIWMLGKNINEDGGYWDTQGFGTTPWPACGEVDIMEHWGTNQNYVQSAMHTPSSYGGTVNHGGQIIASASSDFHVYQLEWNEEKMVFSVDNNIHYTYNPPIKNADTWPFDAEQYFLLNVAILPGIASGFISSNMEIDYVRVYQQSPLSAIGITKDRNAEFYPNPVDKELNINLLEPDVQDVTITIYNTAGQLVKTYVRAVNNSMITLDDLGYLTKGMYFVSCETDETVHLLKMLKK
jgi:beta-glucanase (GH16 family)